jgi:hypothetical protein
MSSPPGFASQPRDHRLRQLDPVHRHSPLRERERDPARADPELERASVSGELDEEIDDRVDDRRVEHLRRGLVVPRGDALVEVAVVGVHRRNLPHARGRDATPGSPRLPARLDRVLHERPGDALSTA